MDNIKNVYDSYGNYSAEEILKRYQGGSAVSLDMDNPWKDFKELVLVDKVKECEDIISFYFKDKEGNRLVKPIAGQYLPIRIKDNTDEYNGKLRTYTLSMKPNNEIYRISVKKAPNGLVSGYLHEKLNIGDTIEAMVPCGLFTMNNTDKKKVLISAGIGITPLIAMLYDNFNNKKDITFIQAVQNSKIQPFKNDIENMTKSMNLKSYVFYSNPLEEDVEGVDYDIQGYVNKEWIEDNLDLNSEFYFCGPPVFMKILNKSLLELGVSKEDIRFEFFGPAEEME